MTATQPLSRPGPRLTASGLARVVVGIDDTDGGVAALRWAVDFARARRLPLVAVRAWDLGLPRHGGRRHGRAGGAPVVLVFDGAQERAAALKLAKHTFTAAVGGVPPDLEVAVETPGGNPGQVLTSAASQDGDVLVVGTRRGLRWSRALHGSVSAYCARHASRPVVVVGGTPGRRTGR